MSYGAGSWICGRGWVRDGAEGRQSFIEEGELRWPRKERCAGGKGMAPAGVWEAISNSYSGFKVSREREIKADCVRP